MKTGFRPDPTVVHPSIGAIFCHELPGGGDRHPAPRLHPAGSVAGRGGYPRRRSTTPSDRRPGPAGARHRVARVEGARRPARCSDLDVIESAFARGRRERVEATLHRETIDRARKMMSSEQLKAFDVSQEPLALRRAYGDTPFGRACLAARRLTEVGVRCVEVTLTAGTRTPTTTSCTASSVAILDPAFARSDPRPARARPLEQTVVLCAGEFGRTPKMNPAGRPRPLARRLQRGAGRRRACAAGRSIGATDPGGKEKPTDPVEVADLHATVLTAVGIDPKKLNQTPIGRDGEVQRGQGGGGAAEGVRGEDLLQRTQRRKEDRKEDREDECGEGMPIRATLSRQSTVPSHLSFTGSGLSE